MNFTTASSDWLPLATVRVRKGSGGGQGGECGVEVIITKNHDVEVGCGRMYAVP